MFIATGADVGRNEVKADPARAKQLNLHRLGQGVSRHGSRRGQTGSEVCTSPGTMIIEAGVFEGGPQGLPCE